MRRLLNHFEQGVGAVAIQVLGRIHDRDPPAAEGGGELEDLQPLPHGVDRNLAREPLRRALPLAADERKIGMGEPREKPRRLMSGLDMEVARLTDRLRGRIGVGEHEAGEPPGERRLADPLPAPDQPGVSEAALAIGREHFRFGALMADQRIDVARMGRAGQRVGFGKIVASRLFSRGAGSCAELRRWGFGTAAPQGPHAEEPRGSAASRSTLQLSTPSAPTGASFEAASRRLRTRWVGSCSCELRLERARRIEPALDRRPNGGGDVVFASIGVDDDAAQRLGRGDVEERPPKGLMKRQPLRFEPVGRPRLPSLGRPLEADFRVEVEDQCQIGPVRADRQALERGDELRRQIPRRALIGAGRIGEPVGNDPGSARKRRQNRLVEMVDAGGGEQERLPGGAKSAAKPERIASRNASAPGEPPGSRVRTTASPSAARRSSSRLA